MDRFCPHLDLLIVNNGPDFVAIGDMCRVYGLRVIDGFKNDGMTPGEHHAAALDLAWGLADDDVLFCDSDCMPTRPCDPSTYVSDVDMASYTRRGIGSHCETVFPMMAFAAFSKMLPKNISFRPRKDRPDGYADTGGWWSDVVMGKTEFTFREFSSLPEREFNHGSWESPGFDYRHCDFIHFGDGSNWRGRTQDADNERWLAAEKHVKEVLSRSSQ